MSDEDPSVSRGHPGAQSDPHSTARPRLGIYGGTFNPIHLGHLRAAEEVREQLGLERIVFIPAASPPHKQASSGADSIAPAHQRLEWLRQATSDNPHFEVDPIEIERGGASFTVDTLRELSRRKLGELPVFVIGRDAFLELGTWREPEALLKLAHFAVTTRPSASTAAERGAGPLPGGTTSGTTGETTSGTTDRASLAESLTDWLPDSLRSVVALAPDGQSGRHLESATWIRHIEITALDISASAVRRRLRARKSIRYLVAENVRQDIAKCPHYAPAGEGCAEAARGPAVDA
jgi:nicotinate-nucleotide adenylyltransferase